MEIVNYKYVLPEFKGRASQKEYDFKQLKREGDYAIFSKSDRQLPHIVYYEAIHIRKHNGYTMAGVVFPPGERYPSDREFGMYGYCCSTLEQAELRYTELLTKQN